MTTTPNTKTIAVSQREYNLLLWFRLQMGEFVSPPQRWSATISAEGCRVAGSFSTQHRVESDEQGRVVVDGTQIKG